MLGSMVFDYLSRIPEFKVFGSQRKKVKAGQNIFPFDAEEHDIEKLLKKTRPNYVINCIGVINIYCRDDDLEGVRKAIKINSLFPFVLARAAEAVNARIIQISTDCVFSGRAGKYKEGESHDALDVYGKTKSLGEIRADNFLNIRCSTVGPERLNKAGLLEWFLEQKGGSTIKGYGHHRGNGGTTLQFAALCQNNVDKGDSYFKKLRKQSPIYHCVMNKSVTKYELLKIFKEVFEKNITIDKVNNVGPAVDRTLAFEYRELCQEPKKKMQEAVHELKKYMEKNNFYNI